MPLPTMPTKPAQLLDPSEFAPVTALPKARTATQGKKPVPALERVALLETGDAEPAPATRARATTTRARAKDVPAVPVAPPVAAPVSVLKPATAPSRRARKDNGPSKLFVLDTNVLMHDPSSLFRFEEHDIYLPMMTLEELDNHKKGMSEVARNARTVSRTLDALVANTDGALDEGLLLAKLGNRDAQGKLFFQTRLNDIKLPEGLPQGKADNQILGVVSALKEQQPGRQVVLVSKDINMRIKARALGLPAEDYFNDQVLEDKDLLYSGVMALPGDFWTKHGKGVESWQDPKSGAMFYRLTGPLVPSFLVNQFVYLEPSDGSLPLYAQVKEINGKTALLQTLKDFTHNKNNVWSVTARNREQNFALNLLMNPEVDFVTLLGQAGTGKTLLALASGLEQVLDQKLYNEIIVTRATVPVGEDIGFLPGTEEEKMQPWMGAFDDNLEVLQKSDDSAGDWGRAATQELIRSRIKVKSMNFMRGRTFVNKFVIIDEAQNLTPKQMKTLVTRAGPGTKIVCLGNIAQIDTPYLTEGSSGLTYVVDRFKGWSHSGHVTLARGERSRLADHAADVL
ncbi:phosphate starvation-inducible protein PhoH [Cupriavidus sp. USMAA2-4]|uniref:Phosphate starvation-inducible protein PhoH n=1 Tax=Cupriavidus malaysiensis TaxID=367825 RepID=A0ABM6F5R8_9BURK|nr:MULTISPECIES: PhoH family protein [Cupriavidus]AOY93602.1 phosphate starvation-inducible protein PhoH [Cupriavidus sp. USMAA2-4]AOZ00120.1 phosphate starvation-inducible protein PhoH [Cupriavidus sp. USMAHM13]AOZ06864.1 phosphate starvation-inducible protein PhoH [Cupriavidus malaysiensis]